MDTVLFLKDINYDSNIFNQQKCTDEHFENIVQKHINKDEKIKNIVSVLAKLNYYAKFYIINIEKDINSFYLN